MSKMSIAVKKTLGLMLQRKPPNTGGHQFTPNEYRDWFLNPFITKAVLFHLVFVKEGDDNTDVIIKQISLVTVTFDQTNEESVTSTIISVYTHLDDSKLPALAITPVFQKEMVELLDDKLRKTVRKSYETFTMKMIEYKKK